MCHVVTECEAQQGTSEAAEANDTTVTCCMMTLPSTTEHTHEGGAPYSPARWWAIYTTRCGTELSDVRTKTESPRDALFRMCRYG